MIFTITSTNLTQKIVCLIGTTILCACGLWWTLHYFVTTVIADPHVPISTEILAAAAQYFPASGHIKTRLATRLIETGMNEEELSEANLAAAEQTAAQAVALGKWNYENYLLLATSKERRGDLTGAATALQSALQLAPNYLDVHWRAANFYLRADNAIAAQHEFQRTLAIDQTRAPQIFALLWESSAGDVNAIRAITQNNSAAQIAATEFLLAQARPDEALQIFQQVNATTRAQHEQTPQILQSFINANKISEARKIWAELQGVSLATENLLWNGSFEEFQSEKLNQFGWNFAPSKYAELQAATTRARTGKLSLQVTFTGLDTTRLSGNIQQLVAVTPGKKYRVTGYAFTADLQSATPLQLAIKRLHGNEALAVSAAIKPSNGEWQQLQIDFTAPPDTNGLIIEIQRLPKFSYDDPTKGTVWFDDFSLVLSN